jgi:hypothetical protein
LSVSWTGSANVTASGFILAMAISKNHEGGTFWESGIRTIRGLEVDQKHIEILMDRGDMRRKEDLERSMSGDDTPTQNSCDECGEGLCS